MTGTLRDNSSNVSIGNAKPASAAIAGRWSTALVEPPLATTAVAAFRIDAGVRNVRAEVPSLASFAASRPQRAASTRLAESVAGGSPDPIGLMPIIASAIAMVLAVNCPPHAPAPGHAARSTLSSSASLMSPFACAPTASNTS